MHVPSYSGIRTETQNKIRAGVTSHRSGNADNLLDLLKIIFSRIDKKKP